jgi:nitronate monooxygenase
MDLPSDWVYCCTGLMTRPTAFTRLTGIEQPVVLGPFGGLSSIDLTATVSNGGGLGSYGLYGYDGDRIRATAAALRERTDRPFAMNLWLPIPGEVEPVPTSTEFARYVEPLRPYFVDLGLPLPERPESYLPDLDDQITAALQARPAVLSVVYGVPSAALLAAAHDAGTVVLGTATTVEEATALQGAGVDAIVASGAEAGGHRVSFLRPPEESLIGLFALLPQVADAVSVPVVAAGGIADARGVRAALALGADAVQVGTAFLATDQSAASPVHRAMLRRPDAAHTVLTRALSGRLARGIPNRVTTEVTDPAPFPVQNWLTGQFRPTAAERGNAELLSLWAGQAATLTTETDAAALLRTLVAALD